MKSGIKRALRRMHVQFLLWVFLVSGAFLACDGIIPNRELQHDTIRSQHDEATDAMTAAASRLKIWRWRNTMLEMHQAQSDNSSSKTSRRRAKEDAEEHASDYLPAAADPPTHHPTLSELQKIPRVLSPPEVH